MDYSVFSLGEPEKQKGLQIKRSRALHSETNEWLRFPNFFRQPVLPGIRQDAGG
jgi:hypothetical protein